MSDQGRRVHVHLLQNVTVLFIKRRESWEGKREGGRGGEDLETERGRRRIDRHINRDDDDNDTLLCKDKGLIRKGIKTFRSLQTEIKQNKGKSNARLICRDSERVRQRERVLGF